MSNIETKEHKELAPWQNAIISAERHFKEIAEAEGNQILYKKEALFAMQSIKTNALLQSCTTSSIQNAVINIASLGLTLNPANQYAYIVPRQVNKTWQACLDVSYKGLIKLSSDSGNIQWAKAVIVYETDEFEMQGIEQMPIHKYDPFRKDRGKIVGGYCAAKLKDDSYLIDTMPIEELEQVRATSKAANGPWKTWPLEMMKKTLIKRASKTWPNAEPLNKAISLINEHEGLEEKYLVRGQISGEQIDIDVILSNVERIKSLIDEDCIEENHNEIKDIWSLMSQDECMKANEFLGDKAKDCNRMYRTLLKDYLYYIPTETTGEN